MKKELTNLDTDCGTLSFKAPEILVPNRHYTSKVDVWAAGLILIILLTGDLPVDFLPRDKPIFKVIEYIRKCDAAYITENERFDNISEEAKDLVEKMLCKDENQRLTVEECLNHKWFKLYSSQDSNPKELSNVLINLKNFKNKSEFKKIILNYLVSQQKIKFNENIPQLFKDIDKDKDGLISKDEIDILYNYVKENYSDTLAKSIGSAEDIVLMWDSNGDQKISFSEFCVAMIEKDIVMNKNLLDLAFDFFDEDSNGEITKKELKTMLSAGRSISISNKKLSELEKEMEEKEFDNKLDNLISNIFADVDKNKDGVIDRNEFYKCMSNDFKIKLTETNS